MENQPPIFDPPAFSFEHKIYHEPNTLKIFALRDDTLAEPITDYKGYFVSDVDLYDPETDSQIWNMVYRNSSPAAVLYQELSMTVDLT